ncbi:MAG TPA: capsule assembly Wzi family protein [Steroidobacteraceae bacterium]
MRSRHPARAGWLPIGSLIALLVAPSAFADGGWFESGDSVLRADLQLLNDAEVIRLPINQWPIPRAAVRYALDNARDHFAGNTAVAAALARVRERAGAINTFSYDASLTAGQAGLLRDFDTVGREDAELRGGLRYTADRGEVALNVTAAVNPSDGEEWRLDGSHATVQWGNWLFSANTLDRWWGASHESSLILSNNARPMPTLLIERATAQPFKNVLLSWLGPWRMSFGISRMEEERLDIDAPLFMAWRVVVMPFKDIELGFSRTAQFCGEQLSCDLETFGNMLIGNDNVGIDSTAETEPGNQMAGFDIRWASPIGNWPYAIYSQFIGEDESSYTPAKFLSQYGLEAWKPLVDGGMVLTYAEFATTTCSASSGRGPYFNCAYNQGRFNVEGYRYEGRSIGHTTDGDAESYALGASYVTPGGEYWSAVVRAAHLNRDPIPDARNTVSGVPAEYGAVEVGWRGRAFGAPISVQLGVESLQPDGGERNVDAFGFVSWRYEFKP